MKILLIALILVPSLLMAYPQVSISDLLDGAEDAERYGGNSEGVDSDFIDEVLGINKEPRENNINSDSNYKPAKAVVDSQSTNCSYYEEDGYQCVPYYQCDDLGEIITDGGEGLIDIRGNFGVDIELDPENSKCPGALEVCCRHPDYTGAIKPKPKPYVSRCGTRNVNGIGVRIQNDVYESSTQFGEFPHMCAILEISGDKNLYVCGGSLIAPNVVMTAAHCVDKYKKAGANKLKVRCGEWDTQQEIEPVPHQDREVEHIAVHPGYFSRNLTNNVALLQTYENFILSAHIDVICLPNLQELRNSYEWNKCIATGWGKDKFDKSGQYQVILKQVELNIVPPYECQRSLRTTRLGKNFNLDPTALCAGGNAEVDTCKGDGGGPLICPTNTNNGYGPQYVQAGIVGWGIGCGKDGIPGVYTDVADTLCYIDWATRCFNSDDIPDDYYGITGCKKWAKREVKRLRRARRSYEDQAEASTGRMRARFLRRVREHQQALDRFSTAIKECTNSNRQNDFDEDEEDFNDYDTQVDLNGYVRIHDNLELKRSKLDEE